MPLIVTPGQFSQRADFYHQLAQLTSAGIGVVAALEQLQRHPPARSYRPPLRKFLERLAEGKPLGESLRTVGWLPEFDVTLIEAGERSGRLDVCFRSLADYYKERASLAKQMVSQLIYPAFLIHFAALIFLVVVPFAGSRFNADPVMLLLKAGLYLLPLYAITLLIIYANQSKHGEGWRAFMETLLRPVPILGSARRSLALARLSLALEALISAGVNIIEAWEFAAAVSGSPALRRAIARWKPRLIAGETPAQLVQSTSCFPETFANLYRSGEVSGKTDETLKRLHAFYQEDGTHKLHLLAQWMPRLVYIAVAIVIAYKVVQFWANMYGPNSDLGHLLDGGL